MFSGTLLNIFGPITEILREPFSLRHFAGLRLLAPLWSRPFLLECSNLRFVWVECLVALCMKLEMLRVLSPLIGK